MHGLEQELVAVHPFVGRLLQAQQRVRAQVALVVGPALARQDGLGKLVHARLRSVEDLHRQVRERHAALRRHEPRVLHVEARLAVLRDCVRVHGEDHVRLQLRLVALADLRPFDHRHADRVPGDVAELEAAVDEALRDNAVHVVRRRAVVQRCARRVVVLDVRVHHLLRLVARLRGADRARDLDPVAARTGDLERRQHHVGLLDPVVARDLELGQRRAGVADEHHVHRQAAAALLDEVLLAVRQDLALALPRLEVLEEDPEPLGVDADAVANGLELELALRRRARGRTARPTRRSRRRPRARGSRGRSSRSRARRRRRACRARGRRASRPGCRRTPGPRSTSYRARRRRSPRAGRRSTGRRRPAAARRRSGARSRTRRGR